MNIRSMYSCLILWVLTASLMPCLGQPSLSKPISVYILDVDTNIKGDFSFVAPELTQVLQTAFSAKHDVFNILERSRLDQLVSANQLESDLNSLLHGKTVSSHFVQLIQADGFIRSALVDGPDGVVLTVTLVNLNSEILWQGQIRESRANWLVHDVQIRNAAKLADEAAARFRLSASNQEALPKSQGSLSTSNSIHQVQVATSGDGNEIEGVSPSEIEQSFEPGQFVTETYHLSAGVGQRGQGYHKRERETDPHNNAVFVMPTEEYDQYDKIDLPLTLRSLSKSHFRFMIQQKSCYLSDENGNIWTQLVPYYPSGTYYPDSARISEEGIELIPDVPIKTSFILSARDVTTGTRFVFVCTEKSPKQGRQIVIRGITTLTNQFESK